MLLQFLELIQTQIDRKIKNQELYKIYKNIEQKEKNEARKRACTTEKNDDEIN